MTRPDLTAFLNQSIADRKLSGGEKSALAAWLSAHGTTDQQRGVVRAAVFETARQASASLDAAELLNWLEDILKVVVPVMTAQASGGRPPPEAKTHGADAPRSPGPAAACFAPGDACLGQIIHRFGAARQTVDACVFTVSDDRITRALLNAHRRGVRVRLITDNEKASDPGSDVDEIAAAGVPVRVDRSPYHMHHKFALFDGTRLLNGSYNWTRGAAEQNEENLIDTGDPVLVAAFAREFARLWDRLGE